MKISSLMISVFVIALFSTGFIGFYSAVLGANGMSTTNFTSANDTSSTMSYLYTMYNTTEQGQNSTVSDGVSTDSAPTNIWTAAFNSIMYAFKMPGFYINMINEFTSSATGMPPYVSGFLIAIIMVIVISALIYMIIGREF